MIIYFYFMVGTHLQVYVWYAKKLILTAVIYTAYMHFFNTQREKIVNTVTIWLYLSNSFLKKVHSFTRSVVDRVLDARYFGIDDLWLRANNTSDGFEKI